MMSNPAIQVQGFGQSIWLDYIHRRELHDGTFHKQLEQGVVGVTSNPTIFQQAIGESDVYDEAMRPLLGMDAPDVYEKLAVEDIQKAADLLLPIYERTSKRDGYVSLEVSPLIANSTEQTFSEAKRLYALVNRPNVMIKIPATPAGIPAITQAIAYGISVNVTLIFAVSNYEQVAEAYLKGLEERLANGKSLDNIASVASFFLSRIDTSIDRMLENNIRSAQVHGDTARISHNRQLLGQAAIANAKLAYRAFERIFNSSRFAKLREAGAQVQRPLWASTGTKNPNYSDTYYVDNIIGRDTVNTLPPKTLQCFIDHGKAHNSITKNLEGFLSPEDVIHKLSESGIDIEFVTTRLQNEGVESFVDSFEKLISQVESKLTLLKTGIIERTVLALGIYTDSVNAALHDADNKFINGRMWGKDGTIWKEQGATIAKIQNRLGWLDSLERMDVARLIALRESVRNSVWSHVVLLGMGGSSLAPEVLFKTFGKQDGFPELLVLDSTNPARIADVEKAINLPKTLFIVASKSGGTIETLSFYKYFYARTNHNAAQFIAITDPQSELAEDATAKGFRDIFLNPADIGGRYSALSYFGLVPAALIGLDIERFIDNAKSMINSCREGIPAASHPALLLGVVIGVLGKQQRDKMTLYSTKSIASFGDWVEQLVAESIGKEGRGIVPVVGATVGKPHDYVSDRLFIYMRVDNDSDIEEMDAGVRALREAGNPRVTLRLPDAYALAGEFFRWEYATAVAGYIYQVNPFDEPNVTEAKDATKALIKHYQEHGALPKEKPVLEDDALAIYADETTLNPLHEICRAYAYNAQSVVELLAAQIAGTEAGDYFGILAYVNPTPTIETELRDIARRTRHTTKRAITVGFGPRYLHSTGQLHKGGNNHGVFFLVTTDDAPDIAIPDAPYSFGTLFNAQALGDLKALQDHKRRALRLHLKGDVKAGLARWQEAVEFVRTRRA